MIFKDVGLKKNINDPIIGIGLMFDAKLFYPQKETKIKGYFFICYVTVLLIILPF